MSSNHTEAKSSITVKLYSASGADFLFTVREGATVEQAKLMLDTMVGALSYAKEKYNLHATPYDTGSDPNQPLPPQSNALPSTVPPASNQPAPAQPQQQQSLTFEAETLTVAIDDKGNVATKVKGGKFTKWGLRVWPETLEQAGFDPNGLQPGQTYTLPGYVAHYCLNDSGKPYKVTQLVRSN